MAVERDQLATSSTTKDTSTRSKKFGLYTKKSK